MNCNTKASAYPPLVSAEILTYWIEMRLSFGGFERFVLHTSSHQAVLVPSDGLVFRRICLSDTFLYCLDHSLFLGGNEVWD